MFTIQELGTILFLAFAVLALTWDAAVAHERKRARKARRPHKTGKATIENSGAFEYMRIASR